MSSSRPVPSVKATRRHPEAPSDFDRRAIQSIHVSHRSRRVRKSYTLFTVSGQANRLIDRTTFATRDTRSRRTALQVRPVRVAFSAFHSSDTADTPYELVKIKNEKKSRVFAFPSSLLALLSQTTRAPRRCNTSRGEFPFTVARARRPSPSVRTPVVRNINGVHSVPLRLPGVLRPN